MFEKRLINAGVAVSNASFNTVLYNGNGSTQNVGGVGFKPDFVWIKRRSAVTSHKLTDIVRGTRKALVSNTRDAETTDTNGLTSFNTNGFTVGSDSVYNISGTFGTSYVAWCWKAGGAAVTNTSGNTTSEVSANVDAGFSIVKFTTINSTVSPPVMSYIGHGLNSVPEMVIFKARSRSQEWTTFHIGVTSNGALNLNDNRGQTGPFNYNFFDMKTSTIGVRNNYALSRAENYIAYCFHSVAGFSKFGSYTGNGSSNGTTVTTGFEPAFVMIKRTDSTSNWIILDNKRDTSNPINKTLNPNLSGAESTANNIDFNATNFRLKSTNADTNASGGTYIYMAFANQF